MDVRTLVLEWVKKEGEIAVERAMLDRGLASTTRFKLLRGSYPNEPRGLLLETLKSLLRAANILQDRAG